MQWRLRTRSLSNRDHTLVMGVVNVTPDSFSDGGLFLAPEAAIAHGLEHMNDGADIIDVGGESTRPGADDVPVAEELDRVLPVVEALAAEGAAVSVDTSKADVARAALEAGAEIINDVTSLGDPAMAGVCADAACGVVLMHMQGTPTTMQDDPVYEDVVREVAGYLDDRAEAAVSAGIRSDRICVDPGIGFGKTVQHNLALLGNLGRLTASGRPVLVGPSRKRFISHILDDQMVGAVAAADRDPATGAVVATSIAQGAAIIRVHNVRSALEVARIADAIVRAGH